MRPHDHRPSFVDRTPNTNRRVEWDADRGVHVIYRGELDARPETEDKPPFNWPALAFAVGLFAFVVIGVLIVKAAAGL